MTHYLYNTALSAGFDLEENQLAQFEKYAGLLIEWNKKMNLTTITEPEEIVTKHFVDSLYGLKFLNGKKALIDVGTGAGFPGIPLKIANPDFKLTLLDSLNKRLTFLKEVKENLSLSNVDLVHSRAEDGAKSGSLLRENFDGAVSRAMANLSALAEYCIPYLKPGGIFLAYKGGNVETELADAQNAIKILGGEVTGVYKYTIPKTDITHSLVVISKIKSTPDIYPRLQGKIQKKPL